MANSEALDSVFQALSDPTRRAVVQRLQDGPAAIGELFAPFDMALPSFMKHIGVLESAGLIGTEKKGRVRTCFLRRQALEVGASWFADQGVNEPPPLLAGEARSAVKVVTLVPKLL